MAGEEIKEEPTEIIHNLGSLDKILIENLSLAERVVELEGELSKYKLMERRSTVRNHLVQKFKIDLAGNDFTVDSRTGTVKIKPKNAT